MISAQATAYLAEQALQEEPTYENLVTAWHIFNALGQVDDLGDFGPRVPLLYGGAANDDDLVRWNETAEDNKPEWLMMNGEKFKDVWIYDGKQECMLHHQTYPVAELPTSERELRSFILRSACDASEILVMVLLRSLTDGRLRRRDGGIVGNARAIISEASAKLKAAIYVAQILNTAFSAIFGGLGNDDRRNRRWKLPTFLAGTDAERDLKAILATFDDPRGTLFDTRGDAEAALAFDGAVHVGRCGQFHFFVAQDPVDRAVSYPEIPDGDFAFSGPQIDNVVRGHVLRRITTNVVNKDGHKASLRRNKYMPADPEASMHTWVYDGHCTTQRDLWDWEKLRNWYYCNCWLKPPATTATTAAATTTGMTTGTQQQQRQQPQQQPQSQQEAKQAPPGEPTLPKRRCHDGGNDACKSCAELSQDAWKPSSRLPFTCRVCAQRVEGANMLKCIQCGLCEDCCRDERVPECMAAPNGSILHRHPMELIHQGTAAQPSTYYSSRCSVKRSPRCTQSKVVWQCASRCGYKICYACAEIRVKELKHSQASRSFPEPQRLRNLRIPMDSREKVRRQVRMLWEGREFEAAASKKSKIVAAGIYRPSEEGPMVIDPARRFLASRPAVPEVPERISDRSGVSSVADDVALANFALGGTVVREHPGVLRTHCTGDITCVHGPGVGHGSSHWSCCGRAGTDPGCLIPRNTMAFQELRPRTATETFVAATILDLGNGLPESHRSSLRNMISRGRLGPAAEVALGFQFGVDVVNSAEIKFRSFVGLHFVFFVTVVRQ